MCIDYRARKQIEEPAEIPLGQLRELASCLGEFESLFSITVQVSARGRQRLVLNEAQADRLLENANSRRPIGIQVFYPARRTAAQAIGNQSINRLDVASTHLLESSALAEPDQLIPHVRNELLEPRDGVLLLSHQTNIHHSGLLRKRPE